MDQYKYQDEEIKARNNLKKKYTKLSNIFLGTEIFLIVFELGVTGSTIALPVITPVSANNLFDSFKVDRQIDN